MHIKRYQLNLNDAHMKLILDNVMKASHNLIPDVENECQMCVMNKIDTIKLYHANILLMELLSVLNPEDTNEILELAKFQRIILEHLKVPEGYDCSVIIKEIQE